MSVYKDFIKANVQKPEDEDILKHYGVMGMKWGVRKEYELKGRVNGPVSNEYYRTANRSFFKSGVKGLVAGAKSTSGLKASGSMYTFQFNKTKFDKVKAWKKKSGGKGGGKKGSAKTKGEKAEKALKEKAASAGKKGGSGGKGKSGSGKSSSRKTSEAKKTKEIKETQVAEAKKVQSEQNILDDYISVDPDFNEKYFTAEAKLGNTNFYAFKRDDGRWVVSDKNKKWVLPEGIEIDKGDFAKKFEDFDKQLKEIIANSEYDYTEEDLDMWYTEAINKIISELKTPQESVYEQIADLINGMLGEQDKVEEDKKPAEYEDKQNETKIDENVAKTVEELEKKKKR